MPPGYPGYSYLCPGGYISVPLTPWVALIGSLAWGLWIEAALLVGGIIWFRRGRTAPRGSVLTSFVAAVAALVVTIADHQIAQSDTAACQIALAWNQHYSLRIANEIYRKMDQYIAQANIALAIAAAAFLIGTFLTVRALVVGWRGRRRPRRPGRGQATWGAWG